MVYYITGKVRSINYDDNGRPTEATIAVADDVIQNEIDAGEGFLGDNDA